MFPLRRLALGVLAVLGWGGVTPAQAAGAAESADPLAHQELVGVMRLGETTRVCLVDRRSHRSYWLTVGVAGSDLVAERFETERGAVFVRAGRHARWLELRTAQVVAMPVVYRDDRSIDYAHMALTERQKEQKAALQMWELMEISRVGRTDAPAAPASPPPANTSQHR